MIEMPTEENPVVVIEGDCMDVLPLLPKGVHANASEQAAPDAKACRSYAAVHTIAMLRCPNCPQKA